MSKIKRKKNGLQTQIKEARPQVRGTLSSAFPTEVFANTFKHQFLHPKKQNTTMNYLDVSAQAGARYFSVPSTGPVVMLNLLRFKDKAVFPEGKDPGVSMTGREAYRKYMEYTLPLVEASGGEVLFWGKAEHFLIGPETETWDMVLLVRHRSKEVFLEFAQHEDYLKTAFYRSAALADSRLLPMVAG